MPRSRVVSNDRMPTPTDSRGAWLKAVLDRFERPLVRYALRLTGDLERARDIVQDTFEKLLAETTELADDHLPRWLFTVCRNRAAEIHRRDQRLEPLAPDAAPPACDHLGPAAIAERNDASARVLGLLATLPENQRECVRLKFQDGLSYKEISAATGLSVSNVGFLIHTALKTIRKELAR